MLQPANLFFFKYRIRSLTEHYYNLLTVEKHDLIQLTTSAVAWLWDCLSNLFRSMDVWNVLASRHGFLCSSQSACGTFLLHEVDPMCPLDGERPTKKPLFIFRCLSFEVRHRHTNGHNFDEQRVKPVNVSQRESNYTFYGLTRRPDSETCYSRMTKHRFLFRQPCLCGKRVLQHCFACVLSQKKLHWFL